jgi:hypothetical protein
MTDNQRPAAPVTGAASPRSSTDEMLNHVADARKSLAFAWQMAGDREPALSMLRAMLDDCDAVALAIREHRS